MTKDEALKLALQLVSNLRTQSWTVADEQLVITAIKEALAQPEPKPMHPELRKMWEDYFDKCFRAQPEQEYHAVNAVHKGQQCYVKAQPEQGPTLDCTRVACMGNNGCIGNCWNKDTALQQRTWVGLTEAQCGVLWKTNMTPFEYYQAIEAKLRSKNNV